MSLGTTLDRLADKEAYARSGAITIRWGQMLRANSVVSEELAQLAANGRLETMGNLGRLHSGADSNDAVQAYRTEGVHRF
jgi:hypothetical protein